MLFLGQIKYIKKSLTELREDIQEELSKLPEGLLYTYSSRGIKQYCERLPKSGKRKKEHRTSIAGDSNLLHDLVRKNYVCKVLPIIDGNIKAIDSFLEKYIPIDENSIMKEFVDKNPELEGYIYCHVASELEDGVANNRKQSDSTFYKDGLKSIASDGTKRRSLGEIIIGSRLDHYNIPYEYEAPFDHPDLKDRFSADFKIRRPYDGKIIYWEHLGKVTDEEYMSYNKYKIGEYEKYGIVPWDNLIISYSQADYGINEKLIDALIQGWLL